MLCAVVNRVMLSMQLQILISAGLAMLALLLAGWQLLTARKLRREIIALRRQIAEKLSAESVGAVNFSTSLDTVERQQLRDRQPTSPRNSAEKYRYIGSLAEQGLDAKGIAAALQMPLPEVEQLLQLAKLKPPVPTE